MFQTAASYDGSVDAVNEQPRPRRSRRRRVNRDPGKQDRYTARKLAGLCTQCGAPAAPDRQLCAPHLEAARVSSAQALDRQRKAHRASGLCANGCGRPSTTFRCFVCAVRAGETPAFSPAETPLVGVNVGRDLYEAKRERQAATTLRRVEPGSDRNAGERTRYHGSGKRGGANQTAAVVDAQDLRYAVAALNKALQAQHEAQAPEVVALPRIQREETRRQWQALADLARRHLDELLSRGGYDRDGDD